MLTLAYFRRRELLKLAPLGLVLIAMVAVLSPRAIGSVLQQFTRSDAANVATVSSRTSAYDAIRPDVWTHLLLGRGWGSYDPNSNRILDSEILLRLIEGGVVGLAAFVLVPASVVGSSRKTIASRDPETAPIALVGASAAVAFFVLAFLYDELVVPAPGVHLLLPGGAGDGDPATGTKTRRAKTAPASARDFDLRSARARPASPDGSRRS